MQKKKKKSARVVFLLPPSTRFSIRMKDVHSSAAELTRYETFGNIFRYMNAADAEGLGKLLRSKIQVKSTKKKRATVRYKKHNHRRQLHFS